MARDEFFRDIRRAVDFMAPRVAADTPFIDAWRINVHAARKYRNRLIHEEDAEGNPVTLTDARRDLGRYFGCLPDTW